MKVVEIGKTAEGRTMIMAIITSPENHARLARYKDISQAPGPGRGPDRRGQARKLAGEGKAVVWIDGGLHATEILGSQQLIETRLADGQPERRRRRCASSTTSSCSPCTANPDGLELVADWYMRETDPAKRVDGRHARPLPEVHRARQQPRLLHEHAAGDRGHEPAALHRVASRRSSTTTTRPARPGTVLFAPPFRDPFNYDFDPLIPVGHRPRVGAAMHNRFVTEGKPGRDDAVGGRLLDLVERRPADAPATSTTSSGILTETIGSPTPIDIPFIPETACCPSGTYPYPIAPQKWHFRQSIDYSITADMAILDVASQHREDFLYSRYLMGRNADRAGAARTPGPSMPGTIAERPGGRRAGPAERGGAAPAAGRDGRLGASRRRRVDSEVLRRDLRDPATRDPRGYVIPADQADFPTATKFVNALIKSGVAVAAGHGRFQVGGQDATRRAPTSSRRPRPSGRTCSTMFEPQDHPNDFPYPGGPPDPPYDSAGWTLAYQMGVAVRPDPRRASTAPSRGCRASSRPPAGRSRRRRRARPATSSSHRVNDAVRRRQPPAQGRREGLLAEGAGRRRPGERSGGSDLGPGVDRRGRRSCKRPPGSWA
ncbi:MAG: hypothetical protein M0C28_47750 [Candidatus Moduliflexus flocculans]|nr:hypothetical protein [Candidatus Moduliflexus flocculans]